MFHIRVTEAVREQLGTMELNGEAAAAPNRSQSAAASQISAAESSQRSEGVEEHKSPERAKSRGRSKKSKKKQQLTEPGGNQVSCDDKRKEDGESLSFFTGNPAVEVISGKLHLYKSENGTYEEVKDEKNSAKLHQSSAVYRLPVPRSTLLCIIAVPLHISPKELLLFTSAYREKIQYVRVLRDSEPYKYMTLMDFDSQEVADEFFLQYNGKLFNSMEAERCKLVYVSSVEFDDTKMKNPVAVNGIQGGMPSVEGSKAKRESSPDRHAFAFHRPPSGMTEIPTCPVCLDRLDMSTSGVFTTACNHSFHCDCLSLWEDSTCPVCRYCQNIGDSTSMCEVCGTCESLWICLICGHIGCGRYQSEHAKQHYQETLHTYALELETQRVWDYAGDGTLSVVLIHCYYLWLPRRELKGLHTKCLVPRYVHRIIQNKQDGKLVEFPDPRSASGERTQLPPRTDADDETMHRKLEGLAVQYNYLLASQLEQQREYYEERLAATNENEHRKAVAELEKEKKAAEKKAQMIASKLKQVEDEASFLRELNQTLIANQKQWQDRVTALEAQTSSLKETQSTRISELESQVRDLMFYLDTQEKVQSSPAKQDLQGGVLMIQEGQAEEKKRGIRKKRGK